jgi:endonuclease-3 related protein
MRGPGGAVKRIPPAPARVLYSHPVDRRFIDIYRLLRRAYGPRRWWPVTGEGETRPAYTGGPRSERQRFEVAAGAILTQNTAWSNAARAIESLNRLGALSPAGIARLDVRALARAIRSAGYFNQKARRLKIMAAYFLSLDERAPGRVAGGGFPGGPREARPSRESLLALNGVGPETADCIMLYAFGAAVFVVDAYTRRLFGRLALLDADAPYETIRETLERNIPRRARVYQEYHALIVEHAKLVCKKEPLCENCLLKIRCALYVTRVKARTAGRRR